MSLFEIPSAQEFDAVVKPRVNGPYLGPMTFLGATFDDSGPNNFVEFSFELTGEDQNGHLYNYRIWEPNENTNMSAWNVRLAHLLRVFVEDDPTLTSDQNKAQIESTLRENLDTSSFRALATSMVEFVTPFVGKDDLVGKITVSISRTDGSRRYPNFPPYVPFIVDSRDRMQGTLSFSVQEKNEMDKWVSGGNTSDEVDVDSVADVASNMSAIDELSV